MSTQNHSPLPTPDHLRNEEIDLNFIVSLLKAHKLFIFIVVLLALLIGGLVAASQPTLYESTALIRVSGDSNNASNLSALLNGPTSLGVGTTAASPAEVEISLIESNYILGPVVEYLGMNIIARPVYFPILGKLNVQIFHKNSQPHIQIALLVMPKTLEGTRFQLIADKRADHYHLYGPNNEAILQGIVGKKAYSTNKHFPVTITVTNLAAAPNTQFLIQKKPFRDATGTLITHLEIKEKGVKTGILQLSYQSENPENSQKILNAILMLAVEKSITEKVEETTKTLNFLKEKIPQVTEGLEASEARLNTYRSKTGAIDSKLEVQILLAEMIELQKNIDQINLKKLEMSKNFTEKHPFSLAINQKQQQLEEKLEKIKAQLKEIPLSAQQTVDFERDIKVNGEIYAGFIKETQQMEILKGSTVSSVKILDDASYPVLPLPSKTVIILLISITLGTFIAIFILLLRHMLSTMLDPIALEKYFGVSVLGIVPFSPAQKKLFKAMKENNARKENYLLCLDAPKDISIEALRSLRTALKLITLSKADNIKKIIALSGCSPSIGKSFVSSNLASLLSDLGERILIIDADMRKGYLHKIFSCRQPSGLSEYLSGNASLDEITQKVLPHVDFISSGAYPSNPAELLMHHRLQVLLDAASDKYDLIIIDTPPILAVTDASLLLKYAHIRLLIVGLGKDHLKEIEHAKGTLEKSGIALDGIICNSMNNNEQKAGGYGYNYNYQYK